MADRDYPATGVTLLPYSSPNSPSLISAFSKSVYHSVNVTSNLLFPKNLFYPIANRTYSFSTRRGRQYELGRAEAGEAHLRVDNSDRLFDPVNSASPLYGQIQPYRGLHISAAYNSTSPPISGNFINDTNAANYSWSPAPALTFTGPWSGTLPIGVTSNDSNAEVSATNNWFSVTAYPTYFSYDNLARSATRAWQGTYSYTNPFNGLYTSFSVLDVPVISGQTYTVSAYVYASAGTSTMSVFDGAWYLGKSGGSPLSISVASWQRRTITITATGPRLAIVFSSPANAQVYWDGVQVEIAAAATTYTTSGPTVSNLFTGFVERWPQSFNAPNRGEVNLVATDYLASMSQVSLLNLYASETLALNPLYYYPLNSEAGATYTQNFSSFNQVSLQQKLDVVGSAGAAGVQAFGEQSAQTAIIAAGTTGASFTYDTTVGAGYPLSYQYLQGLSFPDFQFLPSNGTASVTSAQTFTVECWFYANSTSANSAVAPWQILGPDGFAQAAAGTIGGGTSLFVSAGGASVTHTISAGRWYHLITSIAYTPSTQTAVVKSSLNGAAVLTNTSTASAMNNVIGLQVGRNTNGNVAHLAIYQGDLTGKAATRYSMGSAAYANELLSTRFNRLFGLAGFNYPMITANASVSYAQAATGLENTLLFDAAQQTADSEAGTFFVAGNGTVVFNSRRYRTSQTLPKYSFADSATGTAYDAGEIVVNYDPTYVLNNVTVTRNGGVVANAFDSASTVSYFPRTYARTLFNNNDLEAIDCAFYLLDRYKQPATRVESVVLNPARNISAWSPALNIEVDDLIEVDKAQMLNGTFSVFPCFVERVEHMVDGTTGEWSVRVAVSPQLKTYNSLAAWNTTLATSSSVGASSLSLTVGTKDASDLVAGQMMNIEPASATLKESFAVAGAVTYVAGTPTNIFPNPSATTTPIGAKWYIGSRNTVTFRTAPASFANDLDAYGDETLEYYDTTALTVGQTYTLSFYYRPTSQTSVTVRFRTGATVTNNVFSGLTLASWNLLTIPAQTCTTNSTFDLYINTIGNTFFVDDITLAVAGGGTATLNVPLSKLDITLSPLYLTSNVTPDSTSFTTSTFGSGWSSVTQVLIGTEIMTVTSPSAGNFTVTARGVSSTQNQQNYIGQQIYGFTSAKTLTSAHTSGVQVSEFLPVGDTDPTDYLYSQLNSVALTVTGAAGTITPASGYAYSTVPFAGLLDYNNTPNNDFATGSLFVLTSTSSGTSETGGLVICSATSSANNSWSGTFYPLTGSVNLSADLSEDGTTITTASAVPAGTKAVLIENEWCQVTAGAGTTSLTVVRGTPDNTGWTKLGQSPHLNKNQTTKVRYGGNAGLTLSYAGGGTALVNIALVSNTIRLAY